MTLFDWPVDGDLVVPLDAAPEELTSGMSENWRQRKAYSRPLQTPIDPSGDLALGAAR